ncbi:MAG: helix-turn-helix domain-containing protein [Xenococcaceae cyanobacterium MO_167.B52]|nr:helix-turn-helix domain-containing protein [Xenococcaceae cyanobacterium MO_167.B52]
MQDRHFKKYPPLNLNSSNQIQCSQLYSLAPIGIGTPLIESLTSYIARLALAHCVYPGILMKKIIQSLIDKKYSSSNLYQIYSYTGIINGTGDMALDIADALAKLTFQNRLQLLNLTSFFELLPSRGLLSKYRSWCPKCYESWKLNRQEIYEPLLWAINAVKVCPIHNIALQELCPYCKKKNYHIAWKTRPGYCSNCGKWLGKQEKHCSYLVNKNLEKELNWHLWVANNLSELLVQNSLSHIFFSKEIVSKSLLVYAQKNNEGNIAAFARQLKMPKNTVWLWCKGKNQPSLEMLLRICYCLEISVWDFLTQENFTKSELKISSVSSPPQLKSKAKGKTLDLDKMQKYLERVLDKQNTSPISMVQVAKESSFNRRTLYLHFPELCQKIAAKYSQYRTTMHKKAIKESCEEVRKTVYQLHSEGKFPSEQRVVKRISKPGFLRYKIVKQSFFKARKDLGI